MKPPNALLLGQIAVHEGLVTPEQLETCLRIQETSDPPRKLGMILISKGFLTQEQLDSLIEIQRLKLDTIAADPERGGLFGQIALRLGYVTQLQLDECLREQHSLSTGGSPVLLGQILLRKNYLTTDQFLQILRKQKKETVKCTGCDTIYDSQNHPQGAKFVCSRCGTLVQIPHRASDAPPPAAGASPLLRAVLPEARNDCIGRYRVLEQIGQGGMGVVYKALHRDLNRTFALKVLKTGDLTTFDTVRRFQREARIAAKLKHPNIVSVHDAGEESGIHYIAMEYLEGEPLSARLIARRGRVRDNVVILEKIVRAVAYAHGQGIVHRDLKPANIMVDSHDQPHIMDFGLAKQTVDGSLLTREGAFLGTPFYMAPEQIRGDSGSVDAQSDVYSLGIILYEILTHHLPHTGDNSAEIFNKIINIEPVPIRQLNIKVHPDLETICMKAIEKDRKARYASADALAEDLRRHLEGEPILARPVGILGRTVRRIRKNPAAAVATVSILLLAAVGFSYLFSAASDTKSFQDHLTAAKAQRDRGDLDRARSELELALAIRPGDPEASDLLGVMLEKILAREERARDRRLLDVQRRKAEPRIEEGREAIQRLSTRIVAESLSSAEIAAAGADAEKLLDEALALAPGHERALYWMARGRTLRGDLDGALRHLDEACRARDFLDATFERGRLLLRKYRSPRGLPQVLVREDRPLFTDPSPDSPAVEVFRRMARIDLDAVRQHAGIRWMYHFSEAALDFLALQFESAEAKADSYLKAHPGDPEALALRALSRIYQARPGAALPDLDLALRYLPMDGFLRDWRAIARYLTGDGAGALADLSRPEAGAGTLCIRGTLKYEMKEYAGSLADFQAAVELAPQWADAFAGRAAAAAALDRIGEADADFGRALSLSPEEASHYENRGLLRLRAGRRAEAAEDLERAINLSPTRRARLQSNLDAARQP